MSHEQKNEILEKVKNLADQGLRVIAVGKGSWTEDLPDSQDKFILEYLGLLGFSDPVRESVADAVMEAESAGIRVIMLTTKLHIRKAQKFLKIR